MDNLPTLQFNSLETFQKAAKFAVESKLFGVKDESQAMALMLLCQAEGIHPMAAVRDFHIIQGRPALKAESMQTRFQQAGGSIHWLRLNDTVAEASFSHPQSGEITIKWDIDMAKKAGLLGKDVWRAYPRAMLRSRVISEGIRTIFPGCLSGAYTPEECESFIDVTPEPQKPTTKSKLSQKAETHKAQAMTKEPEVEIVEDENTGIVALQKEVDLEILEASKRDRPSTLKAYKEAQSVHNFKLVGDINDSEILSNLKLIFGKIGIIENDQP